MQGIPMQGDGEAMFLVARNLAMHGDVSLDPNPSIPMVEGRDGKFYSKFGLGQSLVETPFIWGMTRVLPDNLPSSYAYSLQYFAATLSVVLLSALCIPLIFWIAVEWEFSIASAVGMALLFGLGSMIWPYSGTGFSEPLQTFCLLLALLSARRAAHRARFMPWVLLSAAGAGFLGITKPVMFVTGPLILWYLWISIKNSNRLMDEKNQDLRAKNNTRLYQAVTAWTCIFGFFMAVAMGYNWLRFDSIFQFGYTGAMDAGHGFGTPMASGLYGLLFSPGKSIFLYTPLVIVGLAGARAFHRTHPRENLFCWFTACAVLLLYGRWWAWHGDWCWGPRFLMPVIPLAMLPALSIIEHFKTTGMLRKTAFTLLAAGSFLIQIPGTVINSNNYLYLATRTVPTHAFFISGQSGLRDGQLAAHFIPEFSPIAGQIWLLRVAVSGQGPDNEYLAGTPPWRTLLSTENAVPPPGLVRIAAIPDFWHEHYPRRFPATSSWVLPVRNTLLAACFATLLVLCFFMVGLNSNRLNRGIDKY